MLLPVRQLAIVALALPVQAFADSNAEVPGVTGDRIVFAQSSCFSGVCRTTGLQYGAGIDAAFHERNLRGGIDGRRLALVSRDDAYDADTAAANAVGFAADNGVFAVIGGLGTPTALRMAPILRSAHVPFIGVLSGTNLIRDRDRFPNVVNLRTGYAEETRKLVTYMHDRLGARRFGIIYQDDAFGRSVLAGYRDALMALDLPILAKASYSWHSHSVYGSLFVLEKAELDVVMLASTTTNAGDAIDMARSFGHDYVFGLLSVVNLGQLRERLGHRLGPALVARVMPDFGDGSLSLVQQFRSALAAYRAAVPEAAARTADATSLEGYILGRFVIDVLQRMPGAPNREDFLRTALAAEPVVIDGWEISFDVGSNTGSDYVRIIEFAGEHPVKAVSQ